MNQVITANRLRDGVVMFLDARTNWVERLAEAQVFSDVEGSTAALQAAQKDDAANIVLDIYAIDVVENNGAWAPIKLREAIRAQGPTVHPEHGKLSAEQNG